jgi:predicted outer membrane repeat protein
MNTLNFTRIVFFFLLFVAISPSTAFAETFYVKEGAAGNGSSWASPFGDLQKALHRAKSGDEILVAAGIYVPTTTNNRSDSFILPRGVKLMGGFEGTEQTTNTRNWEANMTILSGNIGSYDADDNSYNVVTIKGADSQTILDGFTIEGGNANGDRMAGAEVRNVGGGIYNEGWKGKPSNPQILNCAFRNNAAKDGGAVYNNGRGGNASPTFVNCIFEANETIMDGGAVFNDARQQGKSSPTFTACTFTENKGNYGGGVCNYSINGEAEPRFTNCVFTANTAYMKGGAIYTIATQPLALEDYKTVTFSNNVALDHDSDNVHHQHVADKTSAVR